MTKFENLVFEACNLFDKAFPHKFIYVDADGNTLRVQHTSNLETLYGLYAEAFEGFTTKDLLHASIPQALEYINNSLDLPIKGEFGILMSQVLAYCNTDTGKVCISKAGRANKKELQEFSTNAVKRHKDTIARRPAINRKMFGDLGLDESQIQVLEELYKASGFSFKEMWYVIDDNLEDILQINSDNPVVKSIIKVLLDGNNLGGKDSELSKREWKALAESKKSCEKSLQETVRYAKEILPPNFSGTAVRHVLSYMASAYNDNIVDGESEAYATALDLIQYEPECDYGVAERRVSISFVKSKLTLEEFQELCRAYKVKLQ